MKQVSDFTPNQKVKAIRLSPKNEKKFGLEFIIQDNYNQKRYVICKSVKNDTLLRIHPSMLEIIGEVEGEVETKKRIQPNTQPGKSYNKEVAIQIAVKAMANVLRNGEFYNMVTNYNNKRTIEYIGFDLKYFNSVVNEELNKYTNKPTTRHKMLQTISLKNLLGHKDVFGLYGVRVNDELQYAQYKLEPIEKPKFDFNMEDILYKMTGSARKVFVDNEPTNNLMNWMVSENVKVIEMLKTELNK